MTSRFDPPAPPQTASRALSPEASTLPADSLEERLREALAPNLLLVRAIGAGGMARVFLAREPALKRLVAVKVLSGELSAIPEARARFEREAQAVASLSHPNIVAVHGVGELADGTPYFVMQHVNGRSMSDRVKDEGPLPAGEARRSLGEVAAALAAAHAQGIIHRDIKPANILYEDATGRSLVSDFGIAALAPKAESQSARLTSTGMLVGTPMYMSPEQLLAEPVSEKTDIYSFGLLAHELLAGSGPFKGTTPNELIAAHLRDTPQRLSDRRPEIDTELVEIVARCLEKDAFKRPTADEIARRLSPGGAALLEWPPPGLDEIYGKLRKLSKSFWLGSVLLFAAMLPFVFAGTRMSSALVSPFALLLLIAAAVGALVLSVAIRRTLRLGTLTRAALRNGYGWMTVLESLADTKGDTGNLVSGSREYAALTAAQRSRFRQLRVARELLLLAGGFLAVPLLVLVLILGSAGYAAPSAVWITVVIPALAAAVALILAVREQRAFAAQRGRRTSALKTDTAKLSGPWNEAFDAVSRDQSLGRGSSASPAAGRILAIAAAALVGLMVVMLVPPMLVGAIGPIYWVETLPKFANTTQKIEIANVFRPYVLPKNPAISPLDAGRAFHAINGRPAPAPSGFDEKPVAEPLPDAFWLEKMPPRLFPTARPDQTEGIPTVMTIMEAARRGFTAAERAYLHRLATAPHWRTVATIARASRMDYMGARFVIPFADTAPSAWSLPIPRFVSTKHVAYAGVSRAAYHLEAGRRDSAEVALREIISVGFLLIDGGTTLIEQLIGAVMVGIGRHGLIEFYKVTGDPRGARLQARTDSVVAAIEARSDTLPQIGSSLIDFRDPVSARAAVIRTLHDTTALRGLRMEMLLLLANAPCSNVRELVFGASPDIAQSFAYARQRLARFPSDSALIDLILRMSDRPEPMAGWQSVGRVPRRTARVGGALLRNRRLEGCTGLLLGS